MAQVGKEISGQVTTNFNVEAPFQAASIASAGLLAVIHPGRPADLLPELNKRRETSVLALQRQPSERF
jgi:hypothetical protein